MKKWLAMLLIVLSVAAVATTVAAKPAGGDLQYWKVIGKKR